jgi:uncharacterized protein YndB with AHSA1/START domain
MATTVEQDILIQAPPDAVWRTLTEPEHIARWFADEVDLRPTPGYDGTLTFLDRTADPDPSSRRTVRVEVRSVEPERTFSYRWQHPPGAPVRPGNSVLVTFALAPEGTGTRLRVVESDLDAMGWTAQDLDSYIARHTDGWVHHLGRLHLEVTGQRADRQS